MIEAPPRLTPDSVAAALRQVIDPELDESIVELGFLDRVEVEDDIVTVVFRLPTFWCAPNFAYLMAIDARQAAAALPGVRDVQIRLKDHMYSDEISAGVSCGTSFSQIFDGQTEDDDVDGLRRLFWTKAFGMRQEQLVRFLIDAGWDSGRIVALREADIATLPRGAAPLAQAYLERRRRLGLTTARLITDATGAPIAAADLLAHLDANRRQRISMTFNSLMCRGLLETRYPSTPAPLATREDSR